MKICVFFVIAARYGAMPTKQGQQICSFCTRTLAEVPGFIATTRASSALICDDCVHVCEDILTRGATLPRVHGPVTHAVKQLDHVLRCSFCSRPDDKVKSLIGSPSERSREYICDRCIAVSLRVLRHAEDDDFRETWVLAGWLKNILTRRSGRPHRLS